MILFLRETPERCGSGGHVAALGSRRLGVGLFLGFGKCAERRWRAETETSPSPPPGEGGWGGRGPSQPQGWLEVALSATLMTPQAESQHFVCSFRQGSLFPPLCFGLLLNFFISPHAQLCDQLDNWNAYPVLLGLLHTSSPTTDY